MDIAAADKYITGVYLYYLTVGEYLLYFTLCSEVILCIPVKRFMQVAKETGTVIPVSFYEKHGNAFFNTIAMIDCDGSLMGIYRKSHIPDDHFYQEKFYFTPGDTGFKVWNTKFGCIGVGICWDQWFPEAARCMALMGADMLLYPTAIGSEPILESTLITGCIFDDNYTVFQFGKMCGCAFSHIAFTIKTGHANLRINKP